MKNYKAIAKKNYLDMSDEEFETLPEEEQTTAVMMAGMSEEEKAEYLTDWENLDHMEERAKEWDEMLVNMFGKPKKKRRGFAIVLILIVAALIIMMANG